MDISQKSTDPNPVYEASDPTTFKSEKTGRGPLTEGWQVTQIRIVSELTLRKLLIPSRAFTR